MLIRGSDAHSEVSPVMTRVNATSLSSYRGLVAQRAASWASFVVCLTLHALLSGSRTWRVSRTHVRNHLSLDNRMNVLLVWNDGICFRGFLHLLRLGCVCVRLPGVGLVCRLFCPRPIRVVSPILPSSVSLASLTDFVLTCPGRNAPNAVLCSSSLTMKGAIISQHKYFTPYLDADLRCHTQNTDGLPWKVKAAPRECSLCDLIDKHVFRSYQESLSLYVIDYRLHVDQV